MTEPVDVDQLRQLHEQAKRAPNGPSAGACIDALPALLDAYGELTDLRARIAVAHDVIRRLRDGWDPMYTTVVDGTKAEWWRAVWDAGDEKEPITPAERLALAFLAGPDDTEENRDGR